MQEEEIGAKTGLIKASNQTVNFIADGFWMQGEFTCFLTLDETNKVFIELYSFEESTIEPICDPFFLVDSTPYEQ